VGIDLVAHGGKGGDRGLALARREATEELAGGRSRRLSDRTQRCPGSVVAEDVEVGEMVAADQHGLAQRHQEFASAGAPTALLEGTDGVHGGVDPLDQTGPPDQLGGEQESGEAGEGGVVGTDIHSGYGCYAAREKCCVLAI
jgi:hypothetical protein